MFEVFANAINELAMVTGYSVIVLSVVYLALRVATRNPKK